MQLFDPQITLIETGESAPYNYTLYVVTLCNETDYMADGHNPLPEDDIDGVFHITLKIKKDGSTDNYKHYKPVCHLIDLGAIDLTGDSPWLQVEIKEGGESKGKAITHKENAESDSRPGPTG